MLFPYRSTQYFMKAAPYAVRALSQMAGKAISDAISIVITNSNGDHYSWPTNTKVGNDFPLISALSSGIRTILPEGSGIMPYTGHDKFPVPYQISNLREDGFVEIMVINGETTNSYIMSENYLPFDTPGLTAQANGLVSKIIFGVTSEVATYIYTKYETPSNPILLGDELNTGDEF
jgi:hypothetical protein